MYNLSNMPRRAYDVCVITAANESQAQGYREQLEWRKAANALPKETEFFVFADPHEKRIGSGGSTIYVLYKLLEYFCNLYENKKYQSLLEPFKGKRILILHSGGDSRRLPAYSATGKIFLPLPTSSGAWRCADTRMNGVVALFDILLNNLMWLPYLSDGQTVVASGDVLLSFDPSEIALSDSGVTGMAYPGTVEIASKHGVYVVPQTRLGKNPVKVGDFLQKPSYDELKKCGRLDVADRAFVDTGVMNFSLEAIETLMKTSGISFAKGKPVSEKGSLYENLANAKAQLDIYKEIPFAMLAKNEQLVLLRQIPFYVNLLPYCEFFHIGTSKQLLQAFHTINYTASAYDFQNFSGAKVTNGVGIQEAFIYNSLIDTTSVKAIGASFIEGCYLEGQTQLAGQNILTGIPRNTGDIRLEKGVCATCIPVNHTGKNGWVSVIYGINDSFKELAEDNRASFLNSPFRHWMANREISLGDLWEDGETHELWNARLFPFSANPSQSMRVATGLQNENQSSADPHIHEWRQTPRMSLRDILRTVDYHRLLHNYTNLYREVNLRNLATRLRPENDLSFDEISSWCMQASDYITAAKTTLELIRTTEDTLFQARLYKLLSNVLESFSKQSREAEIDVEIVAEIEALSGVQKSISSDRSGKQNLSFEFWAQNLENIAFRLICEAIGKGLEREEKTVEPKIQIRSDEVVWVCASARLDFAGGWSDTPPYCLEHGGSVLNAAVKLNGQYPIQVIGKLHPEPFIRINSIDLGERVVISKISEMLSYQNLTDWSVLPKAAFVASGIIPEKPESSLAHILKKLGSGIDLTLFSAIPSGSGLGTSSILGSAIIACLSRIIGQEFIQEELFNRTLYMEQLMTTGGGWQDQIGGVVGGVKLIQTDPGLFQIPRISWTDLQARPNADLSDRLLLYYTGYRRMAKNILRNIVGKYLDRDPVTLRTIAQLREKSLEVKSELDHRNVDAFGEKVAEVWELNKTLDPGSSNENIEAILGKISHLISGAKLLGAGGGGFLFIVTKGSEETRETRRILTEEPP